MSRGSDKLTRKQQNTGTLSNVPFLSMFVFTQFPTEDQILKKFIFMKIFKKNYV